jgi:hypothetical protein
MPATLGPPLLFAAVLLLLFFGAAAARRLARGPEGFRASPGPRARALAAAAGEAFGAGDFSLRGLRARAGGADADAADLAAARRLWRAGLLSAEAFSAAGGD